MIGCEECKYFDNKCNIENGVSCSNTEIVNGIYNKAIDDFAKTIKPYIAQYRSAIEHNRYAFIDVNNIAEHLKEGGVNDD